MDEDTTTGVQELLSDLRDELRQMRGEQKETGSRVLRQGAQLSAIEVDRKTLRGDIQALRAHLDERLDTLDSNVDGLYKLNETREQEYLAIKHQLDVLEKKCA